MYVGFGETGWIDGIKGKLETVRGPLAKWSYYTPKHGNFYTDFGKGGNLWPNIENQIV